MFTARQCRTKAAGYGRLLEMAQSPAETSAYPDLHRSCSPRADNLDWLTTNAGKVIVSHRPHAPGAEGRGGQARQVEEERMLRCLGVAVVIDWNTLPPKLQHSPIGDASSIQRGGGAPIKGALAQFLHDHEDDVRRQQPPIGAPSAGAQPRDVRLEDMRNRRPFLS